jgi:hypothetical protein
MTSDKARIKFITATSLLLAAIVILLLNQDQFLKNLFRIPQTIIASPQKEGDTIGGCRNCVALAKENIPVNKGIGEYVDFNLAKKLKTLAVLNSNWRITEAYPPTVRHLSFCHYNGTCVDLGLYMDKRSASNLSILCKDALSVGITILNEYSDPKLVTADTQCPASNVFETTRGGHLHVQ